MSKSFSTDILRLQQEMQYRNYSTNTIRSYCELMERVECHTEEPLRQLTPDGLKNYLQYALRQKKHSVSYINQAISAYKIFVVDVMNAKWVDLKIKRPRRVTKLPYVLTLKEVEKIIALTINLKHKAMITIMYSAGLRKMELLQLKPADIDSAGMRIKVVQGKGKKDRYTVLSNSALQLLRDYYKTYRPKKWLFEPQGNPEKPIAEKTMDSVIKQAVKRANINKEVSCHTLRHSFATHLLEKGVNIRYIQELLGHTSIRTTSRYLHLTHFNPALVYSPLEEMNI